MLNVCTFSHVSFILGASVHLLDSQGSTPLHHAAKNGHLDLCRVLIENGAPAHLTNKQNQTAYDIAENHLVRQYLLPLVLQSEKAAGIVPPPVPGMSFGGMDYGSSYTSQPPPPPQQHSYLQQQSMPVGPPSMPAPMMQGSSYAPYAPPAPPSYPNDAPVTPMTMHTTINTHSSMANSNSNGLSGIQPDGFHSSMSDPMLQAKYGHNIERVNIAPPPMAGGPSMAPSAYSAQQAIIGGQLHNRYVAYDPFQQQVAPQQYQYHQPQQPIVQHMAHPPQQQFQYQQQQQVPPPLPPSVPPQAYGSNAGNVHNAAAPMIASGSTGSQRLLGDRAVFTPPQDEYAAAVPMITHQRPISSSHLNSSSGMMTSTSDDDLSEVVIDASSSSIL